MSPGLAYAIIIAVIIWYVMLRLIVAIATPFVIALADLARQIVRRLKA